jgi:hypothetical protein
MPVQHRYAAKDADLLREDKADQRAIAVDRLLAFRETEHHYPLEKS